MIIIPARLNSYRLMGKVLMPIDGKPMLHHVVDKCIEADVGDVVVATEDKAVYESVENAVMTEPAENGTARVYEAAKKLGVHRGEPIINVQADHPFVDPDLIKQVAQMLTSMMPHERHHTMIAMMEEREGGVRVVANPQGFAQWFTRLDAPGSYSHCGIYGYHYTFLESYHNWHGKNWEKIESLEQCRVMENGGSIRMGLARASAGLSIDTPEDYEMVKDKAVA
jgi:3-deoxy-manno-octulosonate cytidylyltransferase (CMP-KDO synthetase)